MVEKSHIAAAFAAIVLIAAVAALLVLQPKAPGTVGGTADNVGFTTLSLTQGTSYISTDPFFNEPAYTLAVVADGSSSGAKGTFTPDMVGEFTGSNRPSGPFDIQIQFQNQTCSYTLQGSPVAVYSYSTFQYPCTTSGGAYCTFTRSSKIGDVYVIDSVAQYDTQISVSLNTSASEYSTTLSTATRSAEVAGVMRVAYVGALQGTQSCPVPATSTVLYRPINTNQLQPKSTAYLSQLTVIANQAYGGNIDGPLYSPGGGYSVGNANSLVNEFLYSTGQASAYCPDPVFSGTTTTYSCRPVSPVQLPLLRLVVKAATLGVTSPSGIPKIISISSPNAQAGNTTQVTVALRNDGDEQDSFDLSISGRAKVSLQAPRTVLAAGEQKNVQVFIQGAGIIGNYTVTAASVNNPNSRDSATFRLSIDPFCDRPAEPGKTKVSTEYGCAYVCTFAAGDLREKTCQAFGTFEPNGKAYNRTVGVGINNTQEKDYGSELHCVGISQYTSLDSYMDAVLYGQRAPFVPQQTANAFFIGAPICNYWAAYGFKWNGQQAVAQDEVSFYDAFGNAPTPQQGAFVDLNGTFQLPQLQLPVFTAPEGTSGPSNPLAAPTPFTENLLLMLAAGAIVAVAGAAIFIKLFVKKE